MMNPLRAEDVSFIGTLYPNQDVELSVKVAGTVKEVMADVGDPVRRGQPILKLDDERANLELQIRIGQLNELLAKLGVTIENAESFEVSEIPLVIRAREDLDEKRRNLERTRKLIEKGAASREQLEKDETEFKKAEASYQSAVDEIRGYKAIISQLKSAILLFTKDLEDTIAVSPINGFVQERFAENGEYLTKGKRVFRLLETDLLRLKGNLPSRYAAAIRKGMTVSFTVEGIPGRTFTGKISRIVPGIDIQTRSVGVEVRINNRDGALRPGYFVKAIVSLSSVESGKE
jgi:multidrug efflux pump subunit AcrA (membrane-fusion protein)